MYVLLCIYCRWIGHEQITGTPITCKTHTCKLKAVIFRGLQVAVCLSVTEFQGYSDAWHLNTHFFLYIQSKNNPGGLMSKMGM